MHRRVSYLPEFPLKIIGAQPLTLDKKPHYLVFDLPGVGRVYLRLRVVELSVGAVDFVSTFGEPVDVPPGITAVYHNGALTTPLAPWGGEFKFSYGGDISICHEGVTLLTLAPEPRLAVKVYRTLRAEEHPPNKPEHLDGQAAQGAVGAPPLQ